MSFPSKEKGGKKRAKTEAVFPCFTSAFRILQSDVIGDYLPQSSHYLWLTLWPVEVTRGQCVHGKPLQQKAGVCIPSEDGLQVTSVVSESMGNPKVTETITPALWPPLWPYKITAVSFWKSCHSCPSFGLVCMNGCVFLSSAQCTVQGQCCCWKKKKTTTSFGYRCDFSLLFFCFCFSAHCSLIRDGWFGFLTVTLSPPNVSVVCTISGYKLNSFSSHSTAHLILVSSCGVATRRTPSSAKPRKDRPSTAPPAGTGRYFFYTVVLLHVNLRSCDI